MMNTATRRHSVALLLASLATMQLAGSLISPGLQAAPFSASTDESRRGDESREPSRKGGTTSSRAAETFAGLPLRFEENRGQTSPEVKYLARGPNCTVFLKPTELVFTLRALPTGKPDQSPIGRARASSPSSILRMKLIGGDLNAQVRGVEQTAGRCNYFIGRDPKKWLTNVPGYTRVSYRNVYPGIDAVFYGAGRQLEYDLVVSPHSDPNRIGLAFEGASAIRVDAGGALVATTEAGELRQPKPVAYQEQEGVRTEIEASYEVEESRQVRIRLGQYDVNRRLVIDPVLIYSATFGGSGDDIASGIAVDSKGSVYITGTTASTNFPTVNPIQPPDANAFTTDAFVAKLNPAGDGFVYSTYLGGSAFDESNGITVDTAGNAYVVGQTDSADFPITRRAFQPSLAGSDAFVAKLTPSGSALEYSTYLGGVNGRNAANGVAVDFQGSAYVTGITFSPSFPTKRALFPQFNGGVPTSCCCFLLFAPSLPPIDAFLTKLNPSGSSVVYSTYLGGSGEDEGRSVAVDSQGSAYVTGRTCSSDFITPSEFFGSGQTDVFLLKVSASGRSIVYGRLVGAARNDIGNSVVVDASGNAYVTGETCSENLPVTPSAFQTRLGGSVAFKTTDGAVNWSPVNAGLPNQRLNAIVVDPTNPANVYAASYYSVFKSTDAGITWKAGPLFEGGGRYVAIDPSDPATVYVGRLKTTNGGATWSHITLPDFNFPDVLVIDPRTPSTLFAGTGPRAAALFARTGSQAEAPHPSLVFKSTDGGASWRDVTPNQLSGNSADPVNVLLIDPKTPTTVYAYIRSFAVGLASNSADAQSGNFFKSTDGGKTWSATGLRASVVSAAALDPTHPLTIYAGVESLQAAQLLKSTDGGDTWSPTGLSGITINALAIDPVNSSTIYAATGNEDEGGALFNSTDGGETWSETSLSGMAVNAVGINPLDSSQIYAGASEDVDAFVMKFDPAGALVYSTYLGGIGRDRGAGIGIDAAGNAYVAGRTFSRSFPTNDAVQADKPNGPAAASIFVTKLAFKANPPTSPLVYSTYLGSGEPGGATGIAVDGAGKAYITATTRSHNIGTSLSSEDVFVAKLATPPAITGASVKGKKLTVDGEGFDVGAVILLNGEPQKTRNDEESPNLRLIGKKAGKQIPRGVPVTLQVRNSDGMVSGSFSFTRE